MGGAPKIAGEDFGGLELGRRRETAALGNPIPNVLLEPQQGPTDRGPIMWLASVTSLLKEPRNPLIFLISPQYHDKTKPRISAAYAPPFFDITPRRSLIVRSRLITAPTALSFCTDSRQYRSTIGIEHTDHVGDLHGVGAGRAAVGRRHGRGGHAAPGRRASIPQGRDCGRARRSMPMSAFCAATAHPRA